LKAERETDGYSAPPGASETAREEELVKAAPREGLAGRKLAR